MTVVCPKCGAKNRLPDPAEPSKTYRCGKCRARLNNIPSAPDAGDERGVVPQVDAAGYLEQVDPEKPAVSRSLVTNALDWFKGRERLLIFLLALLALLLHLVVIPYGAAPIFDEQYYVPEARSIIYEGELTTPEHPSLGKLFIASGIFVFGDNPWGWRVPSVIFAVASIVLFYFICRKLGGRLVAFLASLLLVFESLTFVISGLAMLDVFALTFMLLAFLLYLHDRYVFSGVSLALSALCKMTGLLGVLVILIHWFIMKRKRQSPKTIGLFLVAAFAAFILLMPLFDFAATREWLNPIDRIWDMMATQGARTLGELTPEELVHTAYPWEWILSPSGHFSLSPTDDVIILLTVWILIIPSMGYMLYEFVKNKTGISLFALLWFAATFLLWIPLVLVTDRQTYLFYFYPTVGAVSMAIGFAMARIWRASSKGRFAQHRLLIQIAIIGYLTLHVLFFLVYTPLLQALASYSSLLTPSN